MSFRRHAWRDVCSASLSGALNAQSTPQKLCAIARTRRLRRYQFRMRSHRRARARLRALLLVLFALLYSSQVYAQEPARLGIVITDLTQAESATLGASGVYVISATPNGPAEAAGIVAKDIILEFDRKPVENVHDLVCALSKKRRGDVVELTVLRDGHLRSVTVTLGRWPNSSGQAFYRTACDVVLLDTAPSDIALAPPVSLNARLVSRARH
jgi:PDZ domain